MIMFGRCPVRNPGRGGEYVSVLDLGQKEQVSAGSRR
jgi:hypothetical protein